MEGGKGLVQAAVAFAHVVELAAEGHLQAAEHDFGRAHQDGGGTAIGGIEEADGGACIGVKAGDGVAGGGWADGFAHHLDDVNGGGGEAGERGAPVAGGVERVDVAGDAEGAGILKTGFLESSGESGGRFGEAGAGLRGEEAKAVGIHVAVALRNHFELDLRPLQRKCAGLDDAEGGKREMLVGEDFAFEVLHAADITGAGDEGAEFDDGCAVIGGADGGAHGFARLLGEQALRAEGHEREDEAVCVGENGGRRLFFRRQGLIGYGLFLGLNDGKLGVRLVLLFVASLCEDSVRREAEKKEGIATKMPGRHGLASFNLAEHETGQIG